MEFGESLPWELTRERKNTRVAFEHECSILPLGKQSTGCKSVGEALASSNLKDWFHDGTTMTEEAPPNDDSEYFLSSDENVKVPSKMEERKGFIACLYMIPHS